MVKSAQRTLDLLELLSHQRNGLSLSDISRALHIPKSSALQILRTLEARKYVVRDPDTNRFHLEMRILQLSYAYLETIDLVHEGQHVLAELSHALDETCHLAILDGLDVVYVAKEESSQPMRMVSAVGRRVPAYATGVGKILLAMLDEETLSRRLAGARLARLTTRTITDVARLRAELRVTWARSFAFDSGESTEGLQCLAAPVMDHRGRAVAAISASVPAVRLPAERRPEVLWRTCEAARRLSRRLGYSGSYQGAMCAERQRLAELMRDLEQHPSNRLGSAVAP